MSRTLAILIGLLLAAAAAETGVRLLGHEPWISAPQGHAGAPLHEPDPALGWRNKPGEVVWPGRGPTLESIRMTFWSGGLRATAPERTPRRQRLLTLGDRKEDVGEEREGDRIHQSRWGQSRGPEKHPP